MSSHSTLSPTSIEQNNRWFILGIGAAGVGGTIALPAVILPWIWASLGAPLLLVGLVIPLIQGGRLVAPIVALRLLPKLNRRKWLMVISSLAKSVTLTGLGIMFFTHPAPPLVVATLLLLALCMGLARGIGRFGQREVMARTLVSETRGRTVSRADSAAGWLALALTLLFSLLASRLSEGTSELLHIAVGIAFWTLAGISFAGLFESRIDSTPRNTTKKLLHGLREMVRTRPTIRRFVILRMLLISLDLAFPFYTVHAAATHGTESGNLSLILLCTAAASIIQGPIWGKLLDRSAQRGIIVASFVAAISGLILVGVESFNLLQHPLYHGAAFLLLATASIGGLNARNLYLVQIATSEERPVISAANTMGAGIIGLGLGALLGIVAHYQDIIPAIAALVLVQISAGLYAFKVAPTGDL